MNPQQLVKRITTLPGYHQRGYGKWVKEEIVDARTDENELSKRCVLQVGGSTWQVCVYARQLVEALKLCEGEVTISICDTTRLITDDHGKTNVKPVTYLTCRDSTGLSFMFAGLNVLPACIILLEREDRS